MKQIFVAAICLSSLYVKAQNNVLLDQRFWREKPGLTGVQAAVTGGNNPSQSNQMAMDPVVLAINSDAPIEVIKFLVEQKGNSVDKITHDARTYIFWAAAKGNVPVMEFLIAKGSNVNLEDSHGATPLSFAMNGAKDLKVFETLIKAGADIKRLNQDGANLLLLAVANDTKELTLTNYLVSKGLSLNSTDKNGNTAFNYAARGGNIDLMKALVEKGVKYNDNAMILASQGSRRSANGIEVFQYLESLKINPNAKGGNGENVLHNIVRRPNQEALITYFLSKGVDVNQADNEGNTPFLNAASGRDTAVLVQLLAKVKNINQANKKGITPLAAATQNGGADVVAFLINHGADVKAVDTEGNNLAYYLVQSYRGEGGFGGSGQGAASGPGRPAGEDGQGGAGGRRGAVGDEFGTKLQLLKSKGLDFAAAQKNGNTLYHLAIAKNDINLFKTISTLGADVNAKNKEGMTVLHKAALISKDDVVLKYLIGLGAKKDITTEFKETAYDLAKENDFLSKNNVAVDFLK